MHQRITVSKIILEETSDTKSTQTQLMQWLIIFKKKMQFLQFVWYD